MRRQFLVGVAIVILFNAVVAYFFPPILWTMVIFGPLIIIGFEDILQKRHTIRRNFPIVGHFRYLFEAFGQRSTSISSNPTRMECRSAASNDPSSTKEASESPTPFHSVLKKMFTESVTSGHRILSPPSMSILLLCASFSAALTANSRTRPAF